MGSAWGRTAGLASESDVMSMGDDLRFPEREGITGDRGRELMLGRFEEGLKRREKVGEGEEGGGG